MTTTQEELYKHPVFPFVNNGEWDEVDTESATFYDAELTEDFGKIPKGKYKKITYLGMEATLQAVDYMDNLFEQKYKAVPVEE